MHNRILITGASGQDGTLLSHLLSSLNPRAQQFLATRNAGTARSDANTTWIQEDFLNPDSANKTLEDLAPDVIFHLSGSSSVVASWESPGVAMTSNSVVTANLLEAARRLKSSPKVVLAGSSEVFPRGDYLANELTSLAPSSPYGVSKSTNLEMGRIYREVHGLDVSTAIMFNHESTIRDMRYVSRSISIQAAAVSMGFISDISVQSKTASKDWGWAPDFVRALHLITERPAAGDFVIATGVRTSVQELANLAIEAIGLSGHAEVVELAGFQRPNDKEHPLGDSSKAAELLGWTPSNLPSDFMRLMVESDIALFRAHGRDYAAALLRNI
jgi:GDPmannose 4,6-dehydratase